MKFFIVDYDIYLLSYIFKKYMLLVVRGVIISKILMLNIYNIYNAIIGLWGGPVVQW